jgi:hypothetical protein
MRIVFHLIFDRKVTVLEELHLLRFYENKVSSSKFYAKFIFIFQWVLWR